MSDIIYVTINGESQGEISKGCGSDASVGNRYQHGHEDEVFVFSLVKSFSSTGAGVNAQGITFCKIIDKSSPLLMNAINNNESLNMMFGIYRINRFGRMEKYYLIEVRGARISGIDTRVDANTLHYEYITVNYDYIHSRHLMAGTEFDYLVTPENYSRLFPPTPITPEAKPPEQPPVRHVTLVLGIFFDGTGNNAANTENMLASCSAQGFDLASPDAESILKRSASELMGLNGAEATSYAGYYTNIHWLSELYAQTTTATDSYSQQAVYIEGIGTQAGKPDSVISMGLGGAECGVIAKTDDAVAKLTSAIMMILDSLSGEYVVDTLLFDIFGFSRGAAAARHFANRIQSEDRAIINAIASGMGQHEYIGTVTGKTRFIGLFDTVAAIGTPANGMDPHSADTGDVNLALRPGVAQKVFHITARNECRYNFALNSVSPAWPELSLPGAHSDIGGGYLPQTREDLFLSRPLVETLPADTPNERSSVYQRAAAELPELECSAAVAPIVRTNAVTLETWEDGFVPADRYGQMQKRTFAALALRHRIVKHDWSMVTLRVMLDAAKEAGLLFDDVDDINELNVPGDLVSLCERAREMGKSARLRTSTVGFSHEEADKIAKSYIHCSANWNAIATDKSGELRGGASASETIGFVNRPDVDWKRTVYNMDGIKQ